MEWFGKLRTVSKSLQKFRKVYKNAVLYGTTVLKDQILAQN